MHPAARPFYLLWDHAHIWALLLSHALTDMGVPFRPVRGARIAAGLLRDEPPAALLVPGGFSRKKMESLGSAGVRAVREYMAGGGNYLGFCGGAGFAVTDAYGLGLCPWVRRGFANRLRHFASGHIRVQTKQSPLVPEGLAGEAPVPVWWPARFAPAGPEADGVEALAVYGAPCADFMMADIRVGDLPQRTLRQWETRYGVSLDPSFLEGKPCIVAGRFGRGTYVLSHAHLETPGSGRANAWLRRLLQGFSKEPDAAPEAVVVSEWDLDGAPVRFTNRLFADCAARMDEVVGLGLEHGLLFRRTPWLFGWKPGTPGFAVSNLYALFRQASALSPTDEALVYWRSIAPHFHRMMCEFHKGLTGYFLAERLANTLARFDPDAVPEEGLAVERRNLFGPPPGVGGLGGELVRVLDRLLWLQLA